MDRASDSGSEGWGFESLPVYQINKRDTHTGIPLIYLALRAGRDSKNQMRRGRAPPATARRSRTLIFAKDENANESLPVYRRPLGSNNPSVKNQRFLTAPFTQGSLISFIDKHAGLSYNFLDVRFTKILLNATFTLRNSLTKRGIL